ncbi:MAG: GntR family transcriptional regulator [Bacillaceae bacterium]
MTKYENISKEMKHRIRSDYYLADEPIPNEFDLATEFGCSRMTVKRALDVLVREGFIFRKQGHGTFIIKSPIRDSEVSVISEENLGFFNLVKDKIVSSKIITFEIEFPSETVAKYLCISMETPVYHIVRLRIVEGEPFVIEKTYMPSTLITGINEDILNTSIYNHIKENLGLEMSGAHRKIRACKSTELDQKYLECQADDPVLEVEQVGFLVTGTPFEYSFSRHRYDRFVFTTVATTKK